MGAKKKRAAKVIEWAGGVLRLPAYVSGEGEPYRPAAAIWFSPGGPVLGMEVFGREARPEQIVASLEAAMQKPMVGPPHAPDRVRVASPDLADALRAALPPGIDVVCEPTPELEALLAAMQEHLAEAEDDEEDDDETHLGGGITAEAMASFFRTAARLYRAAPWSVVPDDTSIIGVTIESLTVRDAVVSIIGQAGESYGFVCFASLGDFETYFDASELMAEDHLPKLPRHVALNFDRGADISPALRKEIAAYGWEVAGANAYPWVSPVDEDAVFSPPTPAELTRIEAIAGAIAQLVETEPDLPDAWERAEPLIRTITVATGAGPIEVTLTVPHAATLTEAWRARFAEEPFDVHASIFDESGDVDEDELEVYRDELLDRFADSPEGESLPDEINYSELLIEHGARELGATPATITPEQLREILFDDIPAKLIAKPSFAGPIVAELRAFFTFLDRAFDLPNAKPCLTVLGGDAEERLQQALSDPRCFSPMKSMLMAGQDAGFDIFSQEGLEAWMRELEKKRSPGSKTAEKQRAKQSKRKAERKARQKNR